MIEQRCPVIHLVVSEMRLGLASERQCCEKGLEKGMPAAVDHGW